MEDDSKAAPTSATAGGGGGEEQVELNGGQAPAEGGEVSKDVEVDLDGMIRHAIHFSKEVEEFLMALYDEVYDRNLENIRKLYEGDFNSITEKQYASEGGASRRWPSIEEVSTFYREYDRYHSLIVTLYSELYFRHIYSKCTDTITSEDRKASWNNYSLLLNYFIEDECVERESGEGGGKGLWLPSTWLWDMLDEFVYQWQDTCRWRHQQKWSAEGGKGDEDMWKSSSVLEFLHLLVERSNVKEFMKKHKDEVYRGLPDDVELKYQLGYFGLICLLRVHVLFGNHRLGLQMVADMEFSTRSFYWRAPACHVTLFYNLGFAFMMLKRYADAVRHVSQLLIFVTKQRGYLSSQSYQQPAMTKLVDKMFILVMICNTMNPQTRAVDETITTILKDKYNDQLYKLQEDDEQSYREMFLRCAPKFVNAAAVVAGYEEGNKNESSQRQLNLFLNEVRYMTKVSNVRSFAKLYNNIQLQKLAVLMDVKEGGEESVRSEMLCVKHKSRQLVGRSMGPLTGGDFTPTATQVDFYLDQDMLHVKSSKSQTVYTEYLLNQIQRCHDLLMAIQKGTTIPVGVTEETKREVGGGRPSGAGRRPMGERLRGAAEMTR
eukprot:GHVS01105768.1.p1 GENE.GHVS01105768.1~~GHVS01105768.1.p1  ORF type:complete len:603 (+),score=99.51 GHVS01105768.1:127-1935(+)